MKKFPTLYKKSSTGAMMQWDIKVDYAIDLGYAMGEGSAGIVTEFGQIGGTIQKAEDFVTEGKNVGAKNETSPYEQAEKEAAAKWKLQKTKKGYVDTIEAAEAGEVDALVEGGFFPMLAAKFKEKAKKIDWSKGPHYIQPKLDGYRTPVTVDDGKAALWTRTRKPVHVLPHLNEQLAVLTAGQPAKLDGEGYVHEWVDEFGKAEAFQMLGTYFRCSEPAADHTKIKLHLYDFPSAGGTFKQRYALLKRLFDLVDPAQIPNLVLVETIECHSEAEAMAAHDHFIELGYEGAIFRGADGEYIEHPTKRSNDLLKIKVFDDAEFKVTGVTEGRGKMAGKAIFNCVTDDGKTFDAKMKGKLERLKEIFQNADKYVGKQLTVQYFGFTSEGKPRHPVALHIREPE